MTKVTIELSSIGFVLGLPSDHGAAPHHVEVPATAAGINVIRKILRNREEPTSPYGRKIGTDASPIQAQVAAWLAADRALAKAKPLLPNLDITELDIEALDL